LGPELWVGAGELEAVEGSPDVERGAADEERKAALPADGVEVGPSVALVGGDRGLFGDFEDVQLMVRDAAPLRVGDLRGADVHAAVELHRVGVDHLDRI